MPEKGANIHAANDLALSNAIYMNHIKVTKLLLDNGANSNNYRRPALLSANSVKMVHLLLSHGANLPIRRHYTQNHHWIINAYMQYQKAA